MSEQPPDLPKVLKDLSNIVETPRTATLLEVANVCDWVVADAGSNVHLPVLKQGIPTVALKEISTLGEDQADLYGFVANRVVFPPVPTLRSLCVEEAAVFYGDEWTERFRRYDASYLQPDDVISADFRAALRTVFNDGSSRSDAN